MSDVLHRTLPTSKVTTLGTSRMRPKAAALTQQTRTTRTSVANLHSTMIRTPPVKTKATTSILPAVCTETAIPTAAVLECEQMLMQDIEPWRGSEPEYYPSSDHTPADREALSEILPKKLYLTNWRGAINQQEKQRLGITHVASVGDEFANDAGCHTDLKFWNMSITDDDDQRFAMALHLRQGASFIHKAIRSGGKVLVHCAAGVSRSTTLVLAYMLIYTKHSLRDAFSHVTMRRRCVWPNTGFMVALIAIEKEERCGKTSICAQEYARWAAWEGPMLEQSEYEDPMPVMKRRPPCLRRQATNLADEIADAFAFGLQVA